MVIDRFSQHFPDPDQEITDMLWHQSLTEKADNVVQKHRNT